MHSKHDGSQAAHVYISLEYIVPNGHIFWQVDFVLGVEQDWAALPCNAQKVGQAWHAPSIRYDKLQKVDTNPCIWHCEFPIESQQ